MPNYLFLTLWCFTTMTLAAQTPRYEVVYKRVWTFAEVQPEKSADSALVKVVRNINEKLKGVRQLLYTRNKKECENN